MIVRHLICKKDEENKTQSRNLHKSDNEKNVFLSGNWSIKFEEAKALIGGQLFLHREKDQKSYFGGDVIDISTVFVDDDEKVIFKFKATEEAKKGRAWEGKYDPVFFCMDSGNVEVDV